MRAIGAAIDQLPGNPYPPAAFRWGEVLRLRVGPYRIMYVHGRGRLDHNPARRPPHGLAQPLEAHAEIRIVTPAVHADLLRPGLPGFLPRLRILLRASMAVSSVSSRVPRYLWGRDDAGMAQPLLDHLEVGSPGKQPGGVRVA
jgi:hypothetical protein